MSVSDKMLVMLDPEDLTAKQLRKILNGVSRSQLPYAKKSKAEQDEDKEDAADEGDALADLKKETNGDGKAPPVTKDDLPAELAGDDEEDTKPTKKGKGKV